MLLKSPVETPFEKFIPPHRKVKYVHDLTQILIHLCSASTIESRSAKNVNVFERACWYKPVMYILANNLL